MEQNKNLTEFCSLAFIAHKTKNTTGTLILPNVFIYSHTFVDLLFELVVFLT